MADTAIAITAGSGTNVDTRTEASTGNHRQCVCLGDPSTNAGVAGVDVTNGLEVQIIPAIPAGENVIGATVGKRVIFNHTPSLLTAALDQDDVLADTEVLVGCFRGNELPGVLESIILLDQDDNGEDLIIYFLDANVVMGTEGAAVSITDANAVNIMGSVTIAAADYTDLIGSQIATIAGINLPLKPVTATSGMYMAIVGGVSNTSTYTASGIKIRLGIRQF